MAAPTTKPLTISSPFLDLDLSGFGVFSFGSVGLLSTFGAADTGLDASFPLGIAVPVF